MLIGRALLNKEAKILLNSENYVNMMENFNESNYEPFKLNEMLNHNNMGKVIRLRKITRTRNDPTEDVLGMNKIENFHIKV